MSLLALVENCRQKTFFQLFTIFTRYLIGGAFVIAAFGMKKIGPHEIDLTKTAAPQHDIGLLFYALGRSGFYWQFIGYTQVFAGLLLMTQKFARLGALIYFPLILNIFIITLSFRFSGTPIITGLMLLANIYLLLWDIRVLQFIVVNPSADSVVYHSPDNTHKRYWVVVGIILFLSILLFFLMGINLLWFLLLGVLEGFVAFIFYFYLQYKKSRLI